MIVADAPMAFSINHCALEMHFLMTKMMASFNQSSAVIETPNGPFCFNHWAIPASVFFSGFKADKLPQECFLTEVTYSPISWYFAPGITPGENK